MDSFSPYGPTSRTIELSTGLCYRIFILSSFLDAKLLRSKEFPKWHSVRETTHNKINSPYPFWEERLRNDLYCVEWDAKP